MEHELEEVERDYIEFRKEIGEEECRKNENFLDLYLDFFVLIFFRPFLAIYIDFILFDL